MKEHISRVQSGKLKAYDFMKDVLKRARKLDDEYHLFNTICEKEALEQAKAVDSKKKKGRLAGLPISVKDCVCVKDVESTAGSRILKGYKPLFDATVIARLKAEDAIIIGKTSQDEFGFGSFNVNVGLDYRVPKNPCDKERATGGSSGGAAGITKAADFPHIAIAESTGGSIECPASFCGVNGFCPTYGVFSRWGLISYADSLDKIGVMSKDAGDIKDIVDICKGHDPMDATSLRQGLKEPKKGKLRIGVIKESMKGIAPEIERAMKEKIAALGKHQVKEVSLPVTAKYGAAVYYIIATSESSTNLARYSGLRYGMQGAPRKKKFNEYFSEIRSKHFNEESKRRILLGTFARMAGYRDAYYIKSTKARTMIIEEYRSLFKEFDILISPTMPILPPKFEDIKRLRPIDNYMMDILTIGPNLAGIPHASVPIGESNGFPIGMMVSGDHLCDLQVLKFMEVMQG